MFGAVTTNQLFHNLLMAKLRAEEVEEETENQEDQGEGQDCEQQDEAHLDMQSL